MKVIEVEDLGFSYGEGFVLKGVTFQVKEGEILGVLGPNSAGKTTLIRLLSKVLTPQEGRVRLLDRDLRTLSRMEVARVVAVVGQESPLFFPFTVEQTVLMGRYPHSRGLFFESERDLAIAYEAMEATGVLYLSRKYVDELSGGEKQRVGIARALTQKPRILLLDEPTAHLDLHHQIEVMGLLRRLNREQGVTVVIVSHDLNLALDCCHSLLLLNKGRVQKIGPPEEVINEETIEELYGCKVLVKRNPLTGKPHVLVNSEW